MEEEDILLEDLLNVLLGAPLSALQAEGSLGVGAQEEEVQEGPLDHEAVEERTAERLEDQQDLAGRVGVAARVPVGLHAPVDSENYC